MLMEKKVERSTIRLDDVIACAQRFCPVVANDEQLFDQVIELNETVTSLVNTDSERFSRMKTSEKWELVLRNKRIPLIAQIVNTVFAIPCSNSFCERIFSLMKAQWTDVRNRLHLSTVTAILSVCINSGNLECAQMPTFLTQQTGIQQLLKNSDKYT